MRNHGHLGVATLPLLLGFACLAVVVLIPGELRAEDKSGVAPDRVKLPKGPGSLEGIGENAEPNLSMGVLGYGVPISVPQGYDGAAPTLRLTYASSTGNGEIGIGWSLPIPSIERRSVHGLPRYNSSDSFAVNGGEELVRVDAGRGIYRVRFEGSFVRYRWYDDTGEGRGGYWTAEYPDGRIGYFGANSKATPIPSARVAGVNGVFRYHLVEVVNRLGQNVAYDYEVDGSRALISRIAYVFRGASARYEVRFSYEARGDVLSDAKPGFELKLSKRLRSIQVLARGQQVRRYALSYETDMHSALQSRLAAIEQYGLSDEGPLPIRFSFAYTGALVGSCAKSCAVPSIRAMSGPLGLSFKAGAAELVDINGDALPDVVDTAEARHHFYINELGTITHGFSGPRVSKFGSASMSSPLVQLVDVDGDGLTDLLNGSAETILFNRGGEDWDTQSQPTSFTFPNLQTDANARFFDYDNDKRIDLLHADGSNTWIYANRGDGRFEEVLDVDRIDGAFAAGLQLADINGDGLQDVVRVASRLIAYRMNLGWGRFAAWHEMYGAPPDPLAEPRFVDLDGDSLADAVSVEANGVLYARNEAGLGFGALSSVAASSDLPIPERTPQMSVRFADMNGSGSTDVVWIDGSGNVQYLELFPERGNLLRRIENGIGKVVEATYGSATAHMAADGGPALWKYRLPHPMLTLDRIDAWDTHSNVHHIQTFEYRNGYYDSVERQVRGFEDVVTTIAGDESVEAERGTYHFNVGASDRYHKSLLLSQTHESAGRALSTTTQTWADCSLDGIPKTTPAVRHVCLKGVVQVSKEGAAATEWVNIAENYAYDGFGNRVSTSKLGVTKIGGAGCAPCDRDADAFGAACGPSCLGDESFEEASFITPAKLEDPWFLRHPYRKRVFGAEGGRVREAQSFYDGNMFEGLELGKITKGLLTRIDTFGDAGEQNRIHKQRVQYDANGAVIASLDANGHRRTFGYDEDSLFVETETVHLDDAGHDPYQLELRVSYHPQLDTLTQTSDWVRVDAKGRSAEAVTRYDYDSFGRLRAVASPGDTLDSPTESYEYVLASPISRIVKRGRSKIAGESDLAEVQCFDGQGRKIQTRVLIENDRFQVSGYAALNSLGKDARTYQPHKSLGEACATAEPHGVLAVSTRYDSRGRPLEVTKPDVAVYGSASTTRTDYAPLRSKAWDEEDTDDTSHHRATPITTWTDGLGRTVRVDREIVSAEPISTHFTYDDLSNLRGYVDAKGNEKVQVYDLVGRVLDVRDPDAGHLQYRHDPVGNRLSATDGRGERTEFTFDEANRPLAHWAASDPMHTLVSTRYDDINECSACEFVAGRLSEVTYPMADEGGGRDRFGYDIRGESAYLSRDLDEHRFEVRHSYDNAGRLVSLQSSLGIDFEYSHDGAGRVVSVAGYVNDLRYDDRGMPDTIEFANGVSTTYGYDALGRLALITTDGGQPQSDLQKVMYTRDRAGNIVGIADEAELPAGFPSEDAWFEYDAWYRLRRAELLYQGQVEEELSYVYDEIDNIREKTSSRTESPEHVGTYRYAENGAGPHAVTHAGPVAVAYDGAGNMIGQHGRTYEWDPFGRLASAHSNGEELGRYVYGPSVDRVKKVEAGHTTYYVTPDLEVRDGTAIGYLRINGRRAARAENPAYGAMMLHDLAPVAQVGAEIKLTPDEQITAADAWIAVALRAGILRPNLKVDLPEHAASDLLAASARRAALDARDSKPQVLEVSYLHENQLGSLTSATDAAGAVVERAATYPYGAARDDGPHGLDYFYTGKETDVQTGLIYFGTRYYMPMLARWASVDSAFNSFSKVPYGYESLSAYAYASNEPIDRVDAVGAWSTTVHTQMLKTYFDTRSHDDPVIAITSGAAAAGSTSVDGAEGSFLSHPIAQTAKFARAQNSWGGAHEHSMRDVGRSQAEMEVLRSTFVKEEAALARSEFDAVRAAWSLTGTEESKAALTGHLRSGYYHLGRMLHPIMDSTSPAHSDSTGSARVWAPHAPGAAQHLWGEGLDNLTPENMQETLRRMDATLEGEMKGYEAFWQGGPGKFSNQ